MNPRSSLISNSKEVALKMIELESSDELYLKQSTSSRLAARKSNFKEAVQDIVSLYKQAIAYSSISSISK